MMRLSEASKNFIFTTKIELDDEGNYITFREPTMIEYTEISKSNDKIKQYDAMEKLAPSCIIEHTFTNDDGTKSSNSEVWDFIKKSSSLESEILRSWQESIPFFLRLPSNQKSKKLQGSTSKETTQKQ